MALVGVAGCVMSWKKARESSKAVKLMAGFRISLGWL
jgi:hypothetical protein